jgi:hypothetical protein
VSKAGGTLVYAAPEVFTGTVSRSDEQVQAILLCYAIFVVQIKSSGEGRSAKQVYAAPEVFTGTVSIGNKSAARKSVAGMAELCCKEMLVVVFPAMLQPANNMDHWCCCSGCCLYLLYV